MTTSHSSTSIRPFWLIRYLGTLVAFVIAVPSTLGFFYLIFHPDELSGNWVGFAFCCVIAGIGSRVGYRWIRLSGSISETELVLRGLLRTVRLPISSICKVERIQHRSENLDGVEQVSTTVTLFDRYGRELAIVPSSVELCRGYADFEKELRKVAAFNVRSTAGCAVRHRE